MLQQPREKNSVVTVKLVSGEELVGYFVEDDGVSITLRKPLVPIGTGDGKMVLAPFIMSSDYLMKGGQGEMKFNKTTVITVTETSETFANVYTQQVSGIDMTASKTPGLITP